MKNKKDIINSLKKALEELDITSSLRLPVIQTIEYLQEEPKSKFEQSIQESDNVVYNEDLDCRVNLSQLKRVAKKNPRYCMYSKDNYTDEDRKVLCDDCEEECEFNKKEESINNGLDLGCGVIWKDEEPASDESEKVVEEIVDPTVLNAYGVKEIANRLRRTMIESVSEEQVKESLISKHEDKTCKEKGNSLTQEPVSIDFEQELYKAFGQVKDFTLSMRIAKWFYDMGKNSQEPVSEDLKEAAKDYAGYRSVDKAEGFLAGANWQKQKNESKVLTEEQCRKICDDAFELGKDAMKQQMMAKAVDAVVKVDAGGYPYIPHIELYDYDKDIPLAKEGDKYKVILIKK